MKAGIQILLLLLAMQLNCPLNVFGRGEEPAGKRKPNRIITGIVLSQNEDSTTLLLPHAQLAVIQDMQVAVTNTDSTGKFSFDITEIYPALPDTFEIGISCDRHYTQTIKLLKANIKAGVNTEIGEVHMVFNPIIIEILKTEEITNW